VAVAGTSSAAEADDGDVAESDPGDPPALRRRDPALTEADRRFWERFGQALALDDPSQPPPRRGGFGWVRYDLGVPEARVVAYRARSSGLVGTYAAFRGEAGARLFAALEAERPEIDGVLRAASPEGELEWGGDADSKWVAMRLREPGGRWTPDDDARHLAWLAPVGNAFVNAFRPRVRRLAAEAQGT
jgi:hypothetical protein